MKEVYNQYLNQQTSNSYYFFVIDFEYYSKNLNIQKQLKF